MTVKEKIQEYFKYKKLTPTYVERELGWGVGAFTKAKSITVDRMKELILLFDDVSLEWLFRDKGEMLLSSDGIRTEQPQQSEDEKDNLIEELKAELNQLKGENRILREMLNLKTGANENARIA